MPELPQLALADADFVTPRLAVGGGLASDRDTARRQLNELVSAGITHIADLRLEWTDQEFVAHHAPAMHYLHHPVDDAGQVIPGEYFEELAVWARMAWREPHSRVLVHCHAGVNRGPSGAFALLLDRGWAVLDALNAIRGARPIAWIDYADDAVAWWLGPTAPRERLQELRDDIRHWRWDNQLGVNEAIRLLREADE